MIGDKVASNTYVNNIAINNVNETAHYDDKIKTVPWIAEVIL